MKIAFFEVRPEEEIFTSALLKEECVFIKDKLTEENIDLAKNADIISIFINSKIDKEIIDSLPNLKLITTRSTGFDHIDVTYAKEQGIKITNVPSYGSATVAEFTLALVLSLAKKIFEAKTNVLEKQGFDITNLQGFDLKGKTLGVIGTGRIGQNVIKMASAFGMKILASDVKPNNEIASKLGFEYTNLETLLKNSDIVTLHVPYFAENKHLINSGNIGLMKKGAYLINTARGELVETDALLKALASKHLAGAGLDVLEAERELKEEADLLTSGAEKIKDIKILLEDHALMNMPNVIVTPHIAFFSKEACDEISKITVQNIKSFMAGSPENLI
ncbi:MAG: NAD(P)-dependent oxidoreductase [bacterium]|nr:NAD(P)-dependent oxidoreductase [bacterium]